MMYKPFILLLGIFLGSHRPAVAQTPPPRIVLAQEHFAPVISILPTVSTSFHFPLFSLRLFQDPEKTTAHFSSQIAGADEGKFFSLEHLSPMNEPAARPVLGRTAGTGGLSEHASPSERAARPCWRWRDAGLSSLGTKLSRRAAFASSLWPQLEHSLWPRRTNRTPGPPMATSYSAYCRRSELNSTPLEEQAHEV